ncbi:TPA: hypothetical protein ACM7F2_004595, partial [Escherichia coli]
IYEIMKCNYIVIAYLPGYSFEQTFLKCAETLTDAHSMNIQTQETIRNWTITPSSDFCMMVSCGKGVFLQSVSCMRDDVALLGRSLTLEISE